MPAKSTRFYSVLTDHKVLVVTLAPNCRSSGPTSHLNRSINPNTWSDHHAKDLVHAKFCGHVAQVQMKQGRYFFGEQPHPTTLWQEHPWPQIVQHPNIIRKVVDHCMMGQAAPNGHLVKKPTVLISNSATIMAQFEDLRCDGQHSHYHLFGSSRTDAMKVWPWDLAERLI